MGGQASESTEAQAVPATQEACTSAPCQEVQPRSRIPAGQALRWTRRGRAPGHGWVTDREPRSTHRQQGPRECAYVRAPGSCPRKPVRSQPLNPLSEPKPEGLNSVLNFPVPEAVRLQAFPAQSHQRPLLPGGGRPTSQSSRALTARRPRAEAHLPRPSPSHARPGVRRRLTRAERGREAESRSAASAGARQPEQCASARRPPAARGARGGSTSGPL